MKTRIGILVLMLSALSCAHGSHRMGAVPTFGGNTAGGGSGTVTSVNAGTNVTITGTATDPVVNATGGGAVSSVTGSGVISCSPTTGGVVCSAPTVQASSAVAITGGTITGVNTATTTTQGAMAAVDKLLVEETMSWARTQIVLLTAQVPQLDQCRILPFGLGSLATTSYADGTTEGGAYSAGAGLLLHLGPSVFQAPKSGKWGVAVRAKFAVPTSGKSAQIGLSNGADTSQINFGTIFAGSTTKWVLRITGVPTYSPTSASADTSFHDFQMFSDGTNTKLFIDSADTAATLANSLVSADAPYYPYVFNTTSLDAVLLQYLVCWV